MPTRRFSIDRARLDRYCVEADAAHGASGKARERVDEARHALMVAQEELRRLERSLPGEPAMINVRRDYGSVRRVGEPQHERYLQTARSRVDAAQKEMARLTRSQGDGAAARQHAGQMLSGLEAHAKGYTR